jgi:hypothetical protein
MSKLISLNMNDEVYSCLMAYRQRQKGSLKDAIEAIIVDHVSLDPELSAEALRRNKNFGNRNV